MNTVSIGTFIRPVPKKLYCFEVVKVIPADINGPEQWWCKRYGYNQTTGEPIKDGHHDIHYLNGLQAIAPGVWKDEWEHGTPRWISCPLYYRKITPLGYQETLF